MGWLYDALDELGLKVLEAIAAYLELDRHFFEPTVNVGNSILRLLHYPPVPEDGPHIRAGAHEDINVITLLLGAEEAGLEVKDRDGRWLPINPPAGALVCNIGDMLQRLTNHVLPSTTHRVVNPAPERRGFPRYSTPFFLHFNSGLPDRDPAQLRRRRAPRPLPGADHRRRLPPGAPARDQAGVAPEPRSFPVYADAGRSGERMSTGRRSWPQCRPLALPTPRSSLRSASGPPFP